MLMFHEKPVGILPMAQGEVSCSVQYENLNVKILKFCVPGKSWNCSTRTRIEIEVR